MRARISSLWVAVLLVGWAALILPRASGQSVHSVPSVLSVLSTQASAPSLQSPPQAPAESEEQYSFAVEIEVVTVPVTVTNPSGEFVTDLNKRDFTVLDNGVEQRIEDFELSWEPLSLVIAVQTSSRVESLLPEVRRAGILFTQLILGETGEAAVLTFDREIKLVQDFTDNADKIEKAMLDLKAGADDVRLSDALARAMLLLQQRPQGRRKVVVVISEARDNGSSNQPGLVLRGAQQLGISVYTIGLSSWKALLGRSGSDGVASPFPPGVVARPMPGNQPPTPDAQTNWGAANVNLLELIAELVSQTRSLIAGSPLTVYAAGTGGFDYASDGKAKLESALSRIGEELRNQYLLTYRPNNLDGPGFHAIRVIVSRPNIEVRTRPGYMFTRSSRKPSSISGEPSPIPEERPPSLKRGQP